MSTNKQKLSWLTGLLTGWGIKESWAKIIAGAVIGALAAVGALSMDSCTPAQVKQAATVHELYHVLSGTDCTIPTPVEDSKK